VATAHAKVQIEQLHWRFGWGDGVGALGPVDLDIAAQDVFIENEAVRISEPLPEEELVDRSFHEAVVGHDE
jgi:hypothetical protein